MNGNRRWNEIDLILECTKLILLLLSIAAIAYNGLQWRTSNQITKENMRAANERLWIKQGEFFTERPYLRTYFYEGRGIEAENENSDEILAAADARLDVMSVILTYAHRQGTQEQVGGWFDTFTNAFRSSPVLCARLRGTTDKYGSVVPVAKEGCS